MTPDELDIAHFFGGGMYAKETRIPQGMVLAQHRHEHDHLSILASGAVMLVKGDESTVLRAPACVTIEGHTHHLVRALVDSIWYCIWPNQESDEERTLAPTIDMQAAAQDLAERMR